MEQVTKNVYAETKVRGCNPAYVVTTAGAVSYTHLRAHET